jgi:hypothetical protein
VAKKSKPLTVSEHIAHAKNEIARAIIGAEMSVLHGKSAQDVFDLIKPILEGANISAQSASNLLHGYPAEEE